MRAVHETPVLVRFDGGNNVGRVPLEEFKRDLTAMLARVKATPRQPGVDEIRLPSERAFRERARNLREGIVIDRKIYDALLALPAGKLPERR